MWAGVLTLGCNRDWLTTIRKQTTLGNQLVRHGVQLRATVNVVSTDD